MTFIKIKKYFCLIVFLALLIQSCKDKPPVITQKDRMENEQKFIEINRELIRQDKQKILDYIRRNNLNMKETGTGMWYSIEKQGNFQSAKEGKLVTINYTISLLDGTPCYSSKNDGVKEFIIGKGGVEKGLEEGILLLKTGGKAKFILPPHLAHGLPGDGKKIPARAIIVYEVELLSLQ
jgi:FKBP-type peptidyl-prolyl cis-trans isomerase FkpA